MAEVDGFAKMSDLLEGFAKSADPAVRKRAQAEGAEYFVQVMRRRSSPRSSKNKKHMLDTIAYEQKDDETVAGWTLFYGRMVESGHRTVLGFKRKTTKSTKKAYAVTASKSVKAASKSIVSARPHMKTEFDASKDEIIRRMLAVYEGEMKT